MAIVEVTLRCGEATPNVQIGDAVAIMRNGIVIETRPILEVVDRKEGD